MQDAREPNPYAYASFLDFFTRKLTAESRPIADDHSVLVSPVDGQVSQAGVIESGEIFQAKGLTYSLNDLLAGRPWAADFEGGAFSTIYLAPIDYHRIHMPISGKLLEMVYVPGQLFSVKGSSIASVPKLFARNERVVCLFETEMGPFVVIMVAATLVSGIETAWSGLVNPVRGGKPQIVQYADDAVVIERGAELGCFHFGSTVIMLAPKGQLDWTIGADEHVLFGQGIGTIQQGA